MSLNKTVSMNAVKQFSLGLWLFVGCLSISVQGIAETVLVETSQGTMTFELWSAVTPKTVANFKKLVAEKFYDGTAIHRVIRGSLIYGGDPLTKDPAKESDWGTGGPGYYVESEISGQKHEFGVISMAHDGNPNQAGSRFLICLAPNPVLNRRYTAFGKLVDGADVLQKIGQVPVRALPSGERSRPTERVEVKKMTLGKPEAATR